MKLPRLFLKKSSTPANQADTANTTDTSKHPKSNLRQEATALLALVVIAILIALFIKAFIIQPYVVDGESMYPTLHNGDRLLVDKLPDTFARITNHPYVPHRGDIIIFNQNNLPGYIGPRQLVKRVIGLPGDKVVIKNSVVTVYDSAHPKGINPDTASNYRIDAPTTPDSTTFVGPNQLFVMGDNRTNSEDSRYFGPINTSQVIGRLFVRIYPLDQARRF